MQASATSPEADHPRVRADWLALHQEPVLEPGLPIIDPHHHLWNRQGWPYLPDELAEDVGSGHAIVSTMFVECRTHYRPDGPAALRPVGEAEFAAACGAAADRKGPGHPRLCEGILGHADLRLGTEVGPVLDALEAACQGRFRGIRHSTAWDVEPAIFNPELNSSPDLTGTPSFREGVRALGRRGLVFDAWVYHPQLFQVAELAKDCPGTQIVLDHVGGPIGIARYTGRLDDAFREWRMALRVVAACPNVAVKIGGLAMRISGRGLHAAAMPPSSEQMAQLFQPYVDTCLELFGPARCMFESNFPVEKASCSYRVLWNSFKRLSSGLSDAERTQLFSATAARIYRLKPAVAAPGVAGAAGATTQA